MGMQSQHDWQAPLEPSSSQALTPSNDFGSDAFNSFGLANQALGLDFFLSQPGTHLPPQASLDIASNGVPQHHHMQQPQRQWNPPLIRITPADGSNNVSPQRMSLDIGGSLSNAHPHLLRRHSAESLHPFSAEVTRGYRSGSLSSDCSNSDWSDVSTTASFDDDLNLLDLNIDVGFSACSVVSLSLSQVFFVLLLCFSHCCSYLSRNRRHCQALPSPKISIFLFEQSSLRMSHIVVIVSSHVAKQASGERRPFQVCVAHTYA